MLMATVVSVLCSCGMKNGHMVEESLDGATLGNVEIASLDEALTFARVKVGQGRHIIAVTRFINGEIKGVDLTLALNGRFDDPIDAYLEFGYTGLVQLIKKSRFAFPVKMGADQLITPVDLGDKHIAVGTNYPAHAGETGVKQGPFLFPKRVSPTGPYFDVFAREGLLDYEVELAAVILRPIGDGKLPNEFGLILSNDFTNRAMLLRNVDVNDVASGKGFTTGKSFPGYLPVGNLFVVPGNPGEFVQKIVLKLYVNDLLRQRSATGQMIWDFETIVTEIWSKRDIVWAHDGGAVSLMGEDSVIRDRTLIMSGTPHGVLFQGIPLTAKLLGIFSWITGGWNSSVVQNVIEAYIRQAGEYGTYLQPEDIVSIHVDKLGILRNQVIGSR